MKEEGWLRQWKGWEEEWNADSKRQPRRLLYPVRRLYHPSGPSSSFQTKSAITPRSRRTSWAAVRPGKSGRLGGVSALRARTIFRLSLRECQPERNQNMLKRTPSASGCRPWSRQGEGRRLGRSLLPSVQLRVHVVLHRSLLQRRRYSVARAVEKSARGNM